MNKIYKSIWNTVTGSWTAVSEAQRAHGKSSKKVVATIALLGLSFFNASALAETWSSWPASNEINLTGTKGIGQGSEVQEYNALTVHEYISHGDCIKKLLLFLENQCNRFQSILRRAAKLHQCFD